MKFLPTNTLGYYKSAPQTHLHNFSELPVSVFSASTLKYKAACGPSDQAKPDDDAVSFYTLNHAASIVRKMFTDNEPLPQWAQDIMSTYTEVCMAQGERMLHYLLLITTREMRHLKPGTPTFWTKLQSLYGEPGVNMLKNISSDGNEDTAMNKYLKTPPAMTLGAWVRTLSQGFHKGTWSGGYGGKPWGDTTDALVAMLSGETSLEMLVDTGYTLAHNGGPIFDKGMMYAHYGANLITVLDVQRSGQMLDLMFESNTLGVTKTPVAVKAAELIKQYCPVDADRKPTLKGYIDWKSVDESRPQKEKDKYPTKYAKVTSAQKQPKTAKPSTAKVAQPVTGGEMELGGKKVPVKVVGQWTVYPHQTVTQYERMVK